VTNNPDIGIEGLQSAAAALAPDNARLRHQHHHADEHKDAGAEAEAEAPGLRLLLAQFTASSGDKRLLSPAMRIELEAVAQRLARVHCHVLT